MTLSGLKRQFGRPGSLLFGSTMATLGFGLISAAIQARLLGPIGRGELAIAMVPGTLIAMLLCFGLPDFFSRKAAQGAALGLLSKLAVLLSLAIGIVVVVPYAFIVELQAPIGSDPWWLLIAYAIGVPVFVYGYCLTAMLVGSGSWKFVAGLRVVPQISIICGLLVVALCSNNPTPLLVGVILIGVSALAPLSSLLRPALHPRGALKWSMVREAFGFGMRGWPAGAIALLNQRVDLLVVTVIASPENTGLYAVATTLAAVLTGIANAVALPARNRVAQGEREGVPRTVALAMLIALVVAAITWLCLPLLIHVVLGDAFMSAAPVMAILLFAQVPLAGVIVLTQCLIGAGKPGSPLAGELLALITTTILILTMFPTFGILSAAFASGVGNIMSLIVLIALAQKHIKRQPIHGYFFIPPAQLFSIVRGRENG